MPYYLATDFSTQENFAGLPACPLARLPASCYNIKQVMI